MEKEKRKIPIKKIALFIFSIFSLTAFMQFILEETIQMQSFGIWPILSNKNISTAEKVQAIDKQAEFNQRIAKFMNILTAINPITGFFYQKFMDANSEKIDDYYRSIYGVNPSEMETIKENCYTAEVGEKCIWEGKIHNLKQGENYTTFLILDGEFEETEETDENGRNQKLVGWNTFLVFTQHPLGELAEIYHLFRNPKEGDSIKVIGRKEIYKNNKAVKLGYLKITGYTDLEFQEVKYLFHTKKDTGGSPVFISILFYGLGMAWLFSPLFKGKQKRNYYYYWRGYRKRPNYYWGKPQKPKSRKIKKEEGREGEEIDVNELFKKVEKEEKSGWKDLADLIISGEIRMRPPKDTKSDWWETLGKGNYMRIFRNDKFLPAPDELATDYGITEDELKEKVAERLRFLSFKALPF